MVWKRWAIDVALLAWSLPAVYFIKDDICASGAGSALAGMGGVILLCVFSLPSFILARRSGMAFINATIRGEQKSTNGMLPAATLIICAMALVLNVAVIIDQSRYLCLRNYL